MSGLGKDVKVFEQLLQKTEAVILNPLFNSKRKTANDARHELFCQKGKKSESLPPTSDSWKQHLRRANYQSFVWKQCLAPMMNLAKPEESGWVKDEDGFLQLLYRELPAAPESVAELTTSDAKQRAGRDGRCKCCRASM